MSFSVSQFSSRGGRERRDGGRLQRQDSDEDYNLSNKTKPQYLLYHQVVRKCRMLFQQGKNQ